MRLREWVWSAEEAKAASALLTPDGPPSELLGYCPHDEPRCCVVRWTTYPAPLDEEMGVEGYWEPVSSIESEVQGEVRPIAWMMVPLPNGPRVHPGARPLSV
jgi:hypothetical protein